MTPLARMLALKLPSALVGPLLTLIYSTLIIAIVVTHVPDMEEIIYIDMRGGRG